MSSCLFWRGSAKTEKTGLRRNPTRGSLLLLQSRRRASPVVPTPTARSTKATDNYPCC